MKKSTLPLHAGLFEIAEKMAATSDRWHRLNIYDPVKDRHAWCPVCHIAGVTKPSKLDAVEDDDPAETRRYDCSVCGQQIRVGV